MPNLGIISLYTFITTPSMKSIIRFAIIFALLYLVVGGLTMIVRVYMTGWQFIVLILVLAGIAEYIMEKR